MKATLTTEEYKEFTESVDLLKREHDIDIPYSVSTVEGKVEIEILEDIDLEKIDNLLDNA